MLGFNGHGLLIALNYYLQCAYFKLVSPRFSSIVGFNVCGALICLLVFASYKIVSMLLILSL